VQSLDDPDDGGRRLDADAVRHVVAWAWGSLSPQQLARFNVVETPVGSDCVVSFLDYVFILRFGPGLEPGVVVSPESIIEPIAGAYALLYDIAFDAAFLGGMDLDRGNWDAVHYFKALGRHEDRMLPPDAPESLAMLRAIALAAAARKVPGYRLALRDVLAAMRDDGDDAFIFAYRAVSDLARAVSTSEKVDWPALHQHLSVNGDAFRERLAPLQDARDAAAHGDESDVALEVARRNRHGLIKLAREIVAQAMIADSRIALPEDTRVR
jgi:hypothetical protein